MNKEKNLDNIHKALGKLYELRREGKATYEVNMLRTLQDSPGSLKKAVNAMCFSCQGGEVDSLPPYGWQKRISFCIVTDCPLYWVRPFQGRFPVSGD